ncbi:hypothetical protein LH935_18390 [Gordonia polyisoprenivorans]|uniref:hypothetical protein n=1 Tax=Gordonia polyisoprenivorans TaxID=84595 RepID=UPI0022345BEE|nr:hypothetical protein [uncultured Gordonia sp.]UZF54692.1 hypothetical protein LH935_18390 [Gordonia polyisoprenivorans]
MTENQMGKMANDKGLGLHLSPAVEGQVDQALSDIKNFFGKSMSTLVPDLGDVLGKALDGQSAKGRLQGLLTDLDTQRHHQSDMVDDTKLLIDSALKHVRDADGPR